MTGDFRKHFDSLAALALGELLPGEQAAITYSAERTDFMRFNNCAVRQSGSVDQVEIGLKLWRGPKTFQSQLTLSGNEDEDAGRLAAALSEARAMLPLLPDDPYQAIPAAADSSDDRYAGSLLPLADIPARVLGPAAGMYFTGLYSQGQVCRGAAKSAGARHWFPTETILVDSSARLPKGSALKS